MRIRTQFILAFSIVAVAPAVILATVFLANASRTLEDAARSRLDAIATFQKTRIEEYLDRGFERISTIQNGVIFQTELTTYATQKNTKSQQALNAMLQGRRIAIPSFDLLLILDPEGDIISSTDAQLIGTSMRDEPFYLKGKESRVVTFSQTAIPSNRAYLQFSGPIVVDDKLVGIIIAYVPSSELAELTHHRIGLGRSGETVIVRRLPNGDAQHISPLRFDEQRPMNNTISQEEFKRTAIRALSAQENIFSDLHDYRGQSVLAATRYLPEADWGVYTKIDQIEAFAPVADLKRLAFFIGILTLFLVFATALLVSESFSRPIRSLTKLTNDISTGRLDTQLEKSILDRSDELGDLSRAFDRIVISLKLAMRNSRVKPTSKDKKA